MKKQKLIHTIKQLALNEMPDILSKIDVSKIDIDEKLETIKTPFNIHRALSYTFATLFILISGFLSYNFLYLPTLTNVIPLETETEITGFQTVSAASLLDNIELVQLSFTPDDDEVQLLQESDFSLDNQIDLLNNYLNFAETVLGNKSKFIYQEVTSDDENYAYAFEYKGTDLANNLISYKGYYNISENNGNTFKTGIIVHNQNTYYFTNFSMQNDNNSINRYVIKINQLNYVEVTNKSNELNQKFMYKIYINGELNNESELTLTSYKNELRAQINIKNNLDEEINLMIERGSLTNQTDQFKIKYNFNSNNKNSSGEFEVNLYQNKDTGDYQYQYNMDNGETIFENRKPHGNQKANDNDFIPITKDENKGKNSGPRGNYTTTERPTTKNDDSSMNNHNYTTSTEKSTTNNSNDNKHNNNNKSKKSDDFTSENPTYQY